MTDAYQPLRKRADGVWAGLHAKPWIRVSTGLQGMAAGAGEVLEALRAELSRQRVDATVSEVGTTGLCYAEPLVDVHVPGTARTLYHNVTPEQVARIVAEHVKAQRPIAEWAHATADGTLEGVPPRGELPMMKGQVRVALRNAGEIDPLSLEQYVARGGFEGLDKALSGMTREQVVQEVRDSGLRGRGGAAFSTGTKWSFLAGNKSPIKYILCNCEEGDPGAFNDKTILETDPFTLVEGCIIAGYATGASNGIVFIRHGHHEPIERTTRAIEACYEAGLLGKNILGTGFSYDMEVSLVGESYVAGEETALMEAVEGKRSMPRFRPPFPAAVGVWGKPSNINNIKTISYVPEIVRQGAKWFAGIGTERSKGTVIACLSGHIKYPGLLEVPCGITMRHLVEVMGGGEPSGKRIKFLQTGGPLGGMLPAAQLDMVLDFDEMSRAGAMFGSGGLIVCNEDTSIVDLTRVLLAFDQMESCGKCFPCRLGTSHLLEILERACDGRSRPTDLDLMDRVGRNMRAGSLCGHGQLGYNPVSSALKAFADEFKAQMSDAGPIPIPPFVGPRSTRRGAQMTGDTPTAQVYPEFVINLQPVTTASQQPTAAG
ncbi:MAG: NADH-quinone oxidoreductase subunit F [SAR202 cluster bacterium]|nr:NADH-quinone oxidoreductase subunit F [SAR202 cluster bacterium]